MKPEHHADLAVTIRADGPGRVTIIPEAGPDHLCNESLVQTIQDTPQVECPEGGTPRSDSESGEEEEMGEVEPEGKQPCPRPEKGVGGPDGCARDELRGDEHD